jgi:hypothetical protein
VASRRWRSLGVGEHPLEHHRVEGALHERADGVGQPIDGDQLQGRAETRAKREFGTQSLVLLVIHEQHPHRGRIEMVFHGACSCKGL